MKKLLLACLILGAATHGFAQVKTLFYYYNGEKFYVQPTYRQLLVGLNKENAFTGNKADLAARLGVVADSIVPAGPNYVLVKLNVQSQPAGLAIAASLQAKSFITWVHPLLAGQGNTLVSYNDAFTARLKTSTTTARFNALILQYHCVIIKQSAADRNTYLVSSGQQNSYDALAIANTFFETGLFEFCEPDFTTWGGLADAPNDPLYNLQWAHHNTGSAEQYNGYAGDDMQVDSAWTITKGDDKIIIAVIDTGVDTAQADLKSNLLQGYDCNSQTANPGDGAPRNLANAHGTACAGIVAAAANNQAGIAGIAPGCKILPVTISNENDVFAGDFAIAGGIDYSWQHGADVLTNSWTLGLPSGTIDAAIHRAAAQGRNGKGCIIFFSAGNDNAGIAYPAYNTEVVAVGGSNMFNQHKTPKSYDGEYWWGANYGGGLDVVAPCVKIAATDISGENGYNKSAGTDGDYYLTFNGTSAAAPHAAAVAALVLSADSTLTAAAVRNIIESNCTKPAAYTFVLTQGNNNGTWNNEMGYGIVNAYKSVLAAKSKQLCNAGINIPLSTLLCKNASIKLSIADSSAGAVYTWRLNGTGIKTGAAITVSQAGSYDVVAVFGNGCTAYTAPVVITAADTTTLQADAGSPIFLCPGSTGAIIGGEPSAKGGNAFTAQQRAYGRDLLYSTFIRFNTDNPRDYKFLNTGHVDEGAGLQFVAGDFTPLGYYAVTAAGQLSRIDTATGYVRYIGQLLSEPGQYAGHSWNGLAWNPVEHKLYGLTFKGAANALYLIDPVSAKTTLVTRLQNENVPWVAISPNGGLYGYDNFNKRIVRINLAAGYTTFASDDIGVSLITQLDGSFDPLNGKLYMTTYGYGQSIYGDLREIDTLTGHVEVKGGIGTVSEVGALAIAGGTYKYAWSPSAGLSNAKDANPVANPSVTTTYTLTVTDACGAKATSHITITANAEKPAVNITADKDSICAGDSARLSATRDSNYTYQWTYNGNRVSNPADTFLYSARGGQFQVTVTNGRGGCINSSKVFTLKDCSILLNNNNADTACYDYFYPPNGFTDTGFRPNQSFTKTVYPARNGDRLVVTFKKFDVKSVFTTLTIYDGPGINSPVIKSLSFYDYLLTNAVYTSSTGPLTFQLATGAQPDNVGTWDAFFTCYTPHVYRSKQSGNFEDASTWQIETAPGLFENALNAPSYIDDSIIIQTGHTVTENTYNPNGIDELWIQKGGIFVINTSLRIINAGRFGIIADGDIQMGKFSSVFGFSAIYCRGGFTGGGASSQLSMPVYASGNSPQVFNINECHLSSLHVLNPVSVVLNGRWQGDSLFMATRTGVLVADSIALTRWLSLDSGIIQLKPSAIADFTGQPKINGGNALSYINGPVVLALQYYGLTSLFYPVGSPAGYRPVLFRIKKNTAPFGDNIKVQVVDTIAPVRIPAGGIDNISTKQYYKIQPAKNYTVDSAVVTLQYGPADGVTDPANLRIARDSLFYWANAGGQGSQPGAGSISSTQNFTFFTNLVLANAAGGANTLPVNWLHLTGAMQGKYVLLQWKVANEINCNFYTPEHSTDGIHFSALAQVPAYNNGNPVNTYQYVHRQVITGINYYRVRETGKDGKTHFSPVIGVQAGNAFNITPNPAHDEVTITAGETINTIACFTSTGRLVKKVSPAAAHFKLPLKGLAAGVYIVRVTTASGVSNTKITIQ